MQLKQFYANGDLTCLAEKVVQASRELADGPASDFPRGWHQIIQITVPIDEGRKAQGEEIAGEIVTVGKGQQEIVFNLDFTSEKAPKNDWAEAKILSLRKSTDRNDATYLPADFDTIRDILLASGCAETKQARKILASNGENMTREDFEWLANGENGPRLATSYGGIKISVHLESVTKDYCNRDLTIFVAFSGAGGEANVYYMMQTLATIKGFVEQAERHEIQFDISDLEQEHPILNSWSDLLAKPIAS